VKYGEPFILNTKALMRAGASRVLAVRPELFGSLIALPETIQATTLHAAATTVTGKSEVPEGSQVAVVSIDGPLAQRGEAHLCGMVDGYDWITDRVTKALSDARVGSVVLRINSPGGDVHGLEEAVRRMRTASKQSGKKVVAFADEMAASAAYWIAAGVADEVITPPTGEVGSIGTIGAWVDESEAWAKEGIKVHIFRDPAGKAAAHPAGPVAEVADEQLVSGVTDSTSRFIAAMSKRRNMSESKLRGLNGQLVRGEAAVEAKLADRVGSLEDAISSAAQAAKERRARMKNAQALSALGLTEEATDAEIEQAAGLVKLGTAVQQRTGTKSGDEALATVDAWRDSHLAAETERAELAKSREAMEADERVKLLRQLISAGHETPGLAWAQDAEGMPIPGEPSAHWKSVSIDYMRQRAKVLCAQPRSHGADDKAEAKTGTAAGVAQTFIIGGQRVDLSAEEMERCKEKGADPARYAGIKLRQGITGAISLNS
jgi:signal peptide peptidase SppA